MLCELDFPRSTIELHAIARGYLDSRRLVTHPRADLLCPLVWRWARSAEQRGLITPQSQPVTAHMRWVLTTIGT